MRILPTALMMYMRAVLASRQIARYKRKSREKDMRKKIIKVIQIILFITPFLLGTVGFMLSGEAARDSAFISLCMYGMEYQDPTPNALVELSRWTAPLATAGGVLLIFSKLRRRLAAWVCSFRRDSVAVYGPDREELLVQLGDRGIDGGENADFINARNYILFGEEKDNFDFYRKYRKRLREKTVYLQSQSLPAQTVADSGLRLFCPEDTAARLFWKERCLYKNSVDRGHQLKVVFLGFGLLGEKLLFYALQDNIFDADQRIEYHIFGDGTYFSSVHPQLGSVSDPVIFYEEPWYVHLPLLEEADMVVVLEQGEQLTLIRDLLAVTVRERIDVFSAVEELELLTDRNRLQIFEWREVSKNPDYILSDVLFERAKRIHLRYISDGGEAVESADAKDEEWRKLDSFSRSSNVSAADYHEVRLLMLREQGQSVWQITSELLEKLSELEHIRWCRFHYLHNWRYGVPENGKTKDAALRIHRDLVPYAELTEGEKEKDRSSVRLLLSIE